MAVSGKHYHRDAKTPGPRMDPPPERDLELPDHSVPVEWLVDFDQSEEARALARITADVELLTELGLAGFAGPGYEKFADILARYGLAVIGSWCRKGKIYTKCADKGYGIPHQGVIPYEDAFELSLETVGKGLSSYRETVLLRHRWDPTRGASIKTYFIGHNLLIFPNIYKRWRREEQRRPLVVDEGELLIERTASGGDDPERCILRDEAVTEALAAVDPKVRPILRYKAQGYPLEEIARRCDLPLSTVKSRLYHLNRKDRGIA